MEPRPTEYQGVVFRSKSEAQFARFLDVNSRQWQYEPDSLSLQCGYTPDFLVVSWRVQPPRFHAWLVEYKPRALTKTALSESLCRLGLLSNHVGFICEPAVCYGSVYSGDAITVHINNGELVFRPGWVGTPLNANLAEQIRHYRFDLSSELAHLTDWRDTLPTGGA